MSTGDPLMFLIHRAGPVDYDKGQPCADCGKLLPLSYAAAWPEGSLVGVGGWLGAVPYRKTDPILQADEVSCTS